MTRATKAAALRAVATPAEAAPEAAAAPAIAPAPLPADMADLSPQDAALAKAAAARAAAGVKPQRWTPEQRLDVAVDLRQVVQDLYPGEELIRVRVNWRHPDTMEVIAESSFPTGEIEPFYGLPFRVGTYKRTPDGKKLIGGSAPLDGFIPALQFDPVRFTAVADDGGPV
jgi:hypothetical protein